MKDLSSESYQFNVIRNRQTVASSITASLKMHDSTTIILALSDVLFTNKDTVSLSYSSGTIKSADNGTLQSFGSFDVYNWSTITTAVPPGDDGLLPRTNKLEQNYPNPFNPTTQIKYSIPHTGYISLKVYNLLGEEIATLFEGIRQAGNYVATFDGSKCASGVYFYRLRSGNFVETKKLVLLK